MNRDMKQRYGLLKRPWGVWFLKDKVTGKQQSLGTRSKPEAQKLLHAKNEAHAQPMLNRQMALIYLSATDPSALSRDWAFEMASPATGSQKVSKILPIRFGSELTSELSSPSSEPSTP
jgi:hypothetical protein